jgi:uncharacterized membrane protein YdbT with pleckstrin-like domain
MTSSKHHTDEEEENLVPENEVEIWEGNPSHWANFGVYLVCILFCWLIFPAFYGIYRLIQTHNHHYVLTSERLKTQTGVFNLLRENLELYRVKDVTLEEPFILRLFGLGDIVIETSDKTNPVVIMHAIDGEKVIDLLRNQVERIRRARRVREIDLE